MAWVVGAAASFEEILDVGVTAGDTREAGWIGARARRCEDRDGGPDFPSSASGSHVEAGEG